MWMVMQGPHKDCATSGGAAGNNTVGRRGSRRKRQSPPPRLSGEELNEARTRSETMLVLLGKLVKREQVRKNTPVLGSPRACRQEYEQLLRASKSALVEKHKRKGLSFLKEGLHLHALTSFKRAIRAKRLPTTLKSAQSSKKHENVAAIRPHIPGDGLSGLVSRSVPAYSGSTTLSMDLGERDARGMRVNQHPPRNFFSSNQHQLESVLDGPYVYPHSSQPRQQYRRRSKTVKKKKKKRLVPSFFTPLSPCHPYKTTFFRDPRKDPRRNPNHPP